MGYYPCGKCGKTVDGMHLWNDVDHVISDEFDGNKYYCVMCLGKVNYNGCVESGYE